LSEAVEQIDRRPAAELPELLAQVRPIAVISIAHPAIQ
jgi:hypothetical protein